MSRELIRLIRIGARPKKRGFLRRSELFRINSYPKGKKSFFFICLSLPLGTNLRINTKKLPNALFINGLARAARYELIRINCRAAPAGGRP
jgi:hypothetical protein